MTWSGGFATLAGVGLVLMSVPWVIFSAYLFVLTLCSGRRRPDLYPEPKMRFDFVVPAHDEETGIGATVASLRAVDYPDGLFRVLVIADNCTDGTAERAREAGATVLVRTSADQRGKGYALAHAFERSLSEKFADAVVVIDADTVITPNLLRAFSARFQAGALAVQADYGVRNPGAGWRTRLMVIALALFHVLRSLGRERLGVSSGLRGNGMGFAVGLLSEVPYDAFSVVEDLEYGIRLGAAGHRVHYVGDAHVLGEMVSGEKASRSQRTRWEAGRGALARIQGPKLLRRAFAERSGLLFDLAMDVCIPPLSSVVTAVVLGTVLATACSAWAAAEGAAVFAYIPWALSTAFLACYVVRGIVLADTGWAGVRDLAWAPLYMIWKLVLAIRQSRKRKDEWVRTSREETP